MLPLVVLEDAAAGASEVLAVARKPGGGSVIGVEVAHPHVVLVGHVVVEQPTTPAMRLRSRPAVLAAHAAADLAAELLGDQLGAVADAEDRDAEVVDGRVELRVRPRRGRSSARRTG